MRRLGSYFLASALKAAARVLRDRGETENLVQLAREKAAKNLGRLEKIVDDLNSLFRLVKAWASGAYREIPWKAIVSAVAALIYFLNPFDFIPDLIPFSGFLDDVAVVGFVMASIKSEIEKFLAWERGEEQMITNEPS
jgi:uncharacterized membrane protein YkvA (DUF1232 family)